MGLLLCGLCGSGKLCISNIIANSMGYQVKEFNLLSKIKSMNDTNCRIKADIVKDGILEAICMKHTFSTDKRPILVLVNQADVIESQKLYFLLASVGSEKGILDIDHLSRKILKKKKNLSLKYLNKIQDFSIEKRLKHILQCENLNITSDLILLIAKISSGDLKRAIIILEISTCKLGSNRTILKEEVYFSCKFFGGNVDIFSYSSENITFILLSEKFSTQKITIDQVSLQFNRKSEQSLSGDKLYQIISKIQLYEKMCINPLQSIIDRISGQKAMILFLLRNNIPEVIQDRYQHHKHPWTNSTAKKSLSQICDLWSFSDIFSKKYDKISTELKEYFDIGYLVALSKLSDQQYREFRDISWKRINSEKSIKIAISKMKMLE
jgi:DNA polymerase III delta prime subunit